MTLILTVSLSKSGADSRTGGGIAAIRNSNEMLDRDYRWQLRKAFMGCKLPGLGFQALIDLKEIFESYGQSVKSDRLIISTVMKREGPSLMTNFKWGKLIKDYRLLDGETHPYYVLDGHPCRLSSIQADLIFADIAKHSRHPPTPINNVPALKLKLAWPDFLDCLCELAHMRYPSLPLKVKSLNLSPILILSSLIQTCFNPEGCGFAHPDVRYYRTRGPASSNTAN